MENIRLTSWYGKYPNIFPGFHRCQVVFSPDFWTINSITEAMNLVILSGWTSHVKAGFFSEFLYEGFFGGPVSPAKSPEMFGEK